MDDTITAVRELYESLSSGKYPYDFWYSSHHGDVECNHKWYYYEDGYDIKLFTFKPCIQETREDFLPIEKELKVDKVYFYGRLESNMVAICFLRHKTPSVDLKVFSLDDSMLAIEWDFESYNRGVDMISLIRKLYDIISKMETFSQTDLFMSMEYCGVHKPSAASN
jgi:hypothetical protein